MWGVVVIDFDFVKDGIFIGGNIRHKSGGLLVAYLPIARPKPSKIGTVALHKFIGGNALLSRLVFIIVVSASSVFIWFSIIESRVPGQLTAMSDNNVFKQKLKRSDAGTPMRENKPLLFYFILFHFINLRSDFFGLPSSTQTAFGNDLFKRRTYGTIFASC